MGCKHNGFKEYVDACDPCYVVEMEFAARMCAEIANREGLCHGCYHKLACCRKRGCFAFKPFKQEWREAVHECATSRSPRVLRAKIKKMGV